MPVPERGPLHRTRASSESNPSRRRLLAAVATAGVAATSGCSILSDAHPPGTLVLANEDDVVHDLRVAAELGEHGGSTVAEKSATLEPGDERVFESLLDEDVRYRMTAELRNGERFDFDFEPRDEGTHFPRRAG